VCIHEIKLPASVCLRVLLASQQLGSASLRVGEVRQSIKTKAFFIFSLSFSVMWSVLSPSYPVCSTSVPFFSWITVSRLCTVPVQTLGRELRWPFPPSLENGTLGSAIQSRRSPLWRLLSTSILASIFTRDMRWFHRESE
jgi:hypothetical protein